MARPRWIEKFTSVDGLTEYSFPRYEHQVSIRQDTRQSLLPAVGSDFAYDQLRSQVSPRDPAEISLQYTITSSPVDIAAINDELDTSRYVLYRIGTGKLFSLDHLGVRRWAYARIINMPSHDLDTNNRYGIPIKCKFVQLSDWYGETQTVVTESISSTPHLFTLTNNGSFDARNLIIQFQANSAGGFTNPKLTNLSNGLSVQITRTAGGANDEAKIDTGAFSAKYSTNNGASYSDDYANLAIGTDAIAFMQLMRGDNSMQYTDDGTPDLDLVISYYDTYL